MRQINNIELVRSMKTTA